MSIGPPLSAAAASERASVAEGPWLPHMQYADLDQQQDTMVLGTWVFLATELMVFGPLFTGFAIYHAAYPEAFEAGSGKLSLAIAALNTVILLSSSLTMVLAVHAVRTGQRRWAGLCLLFTASLGTLFLIVKAFEYRLDYLDGLMPGVNFDLADWPHPGQVKLFLLFYYIMTLLHAVHLSVGIVLVLFMAWLTKRGQLGPEYHGPVEAVGLYWHFVDAVWVFLLPLLYITATHPAP